MPVFRLTTSLWWIAPSLVCSGNKSEQSIDPSDLQIGQMLGGADNIAEIDRRISALFFRVVDSLDAITSAELSFNNLDAAKPDIDTPSM